MAAGDFWKDQTKKKITISYLMDWVVIIVFAAIFLSLSLLEPYHQQFSLSDPSISYPYTVHESVPTWLLALVCLVFPVVIIVGWTIFVQRSTLDLNHGLLGLCLALTLTAMLVDVIKNVTGRPRPDLLSRCQPPPNVSVPQYELANYTICTVAADTSIMKDAFRSFPSGHSAYSFAGLGFLSLFLSGKLFLFDRHGNAYKAMVFWVPLFGAFLIAMTRVRDYRHHYTDVLIGGILGYLTAVFSYHMYYPPLTHLGKPYRDRIRMYSGAQTDIESSSVAESV
ncbi:phosphatidic acid phosphatase type 2/haloperoxidase [Gongronella butleri]|nr:phosphatidic acid phosphatase type 2/haloperoxidase [Gongronella butleri]